MNFNELNMQAYDNERKQWCKVTDIDVDRNSIGLSNGIVRFWRDLDKTEILFNKTVKKPIKKKFYYGDTVQVIGALYTRGKIGKIIKDVDNIQETNKIKIEFDNIFVGWYKRNDLKLVFRNRKKNRELVV